MTPDYRMPQRVRQINPLLQETQFFKFNLLCMIPPYLKLYFNPIFI